MVASVPSAPSTPARQGRSASRTASDRRGATWVSPERAVSEQLARSPKHAAAARCIGCPRPHRRDSHPGRRRFSGQTRDGRYCRAARYYHPGLQRFISEDPIGFAAGDVNLYGYVANNPFSFTDPFGLDKKSVATSPDETCSLGLPVLPPGEDLSRNIAFARRHRLRLLDPIGSAVSLTWFAIQVRPKIGPIRPGSWDYKRQAIPGRPSGPSPFVLGGNYNYGVTASALGLPPGVVLRAAGLVQILERRSAPGWSHPFPGGLAPYGDDPDDQWMISAGIDYYEQCAR